ncbi:IS21 family transposase [Serratia marcescens]|nr:IS21 family transposase [Serratia marcescens]
METIGKIRRRHLIKGESISSIARSLGISRNTVKKYLNTEDAPTYHRERQNRPQLGTFINQLEEWLTFDMGLPKSQRRTSRRLFECLQAEGYRGAYDSVQRHVKRWKHNRSQSKITNAYVPLSFPPADVCQFDWSHEYVVVGGVSQTIKLAHFRLAYSRKMFVIAYPRETQEMVLDAHAKAFEFFGGVPKKMIYDNLKTVVDTIFTGKERRFNARFLAMANHYLFEPIACTPASGWEKGQVENQVGNVREWLFTPTPKFNDISSLNEWLEKRCEELSARTHPQEPCSIAESFQNERYLLTPVKMPFISYIEQAQRVSSTCLVTIDRNRYSVPADWAGKVISVRISSNDIIFMSEGKEIARHIRSFGRDKFVCNPWHYVPILETKPGAIRHGQPFVEWSLPKSIERVKEVLLTQSKGDRGFAEILLVARSTGLEALDVACQLALEYGKPSVAVILNELRRLTEPQRNKDTNVSLGLKLKTDPEANCDRYNTLLERNNV